MVVDKAPRSSGCHVQRLYETTMVDELSEYFSKDLIASDLRKDDIASISWKLLFARVRVANRAISVQSRRRLHSRVPQRWALGRLLRCPRKAVRGDLRYGRRPCRVQS